jgi:hypothetical protein
VSFKIRVFLKKRLVSISCFLSEKQRFWHFLALSKCRLGDSDNGRGMTQSPPLSYWSPEKSYMTSSRTATKVFIAARFRVNVVFLFFSFHGEDIAVLTIEV